MQVHAAAMVSVHSCTDIAGFSSFSRLQDGWQRLSFRIHLRLISFFQKQRTQPTAKEVTITRDMAVISVPTSVEVVSFVSRDSRLRETERRHGTFPFPLSIAVVPAPSLSTSPPSRVSCSWAYHIPIVCSLRIQIIAIFKIDYGVRVSSC